MQATLIAKETLLCVSLSVALLAAVGCGAKAYPHPALVPPDGAAAVVVFIRQKHAIGSAGALGFRFDGEPIVRLRSGQYTRLAVAPGQYAVST